MAVPTIGEMSIRIAQLFAGRGNNGHSGAHGARQARSATVKLF